MAEPRNSMPGSRPTVWAVAAAAGVSKTTVSRVLTGSPRVSAEAREAVKKAIDDLGYIPNRAARSLVTRRTDTIALIVSEPEARLFSEPFFAGAVRGINQALAQTEYAFVLLSCEGDTSRVERYVMNGHADGVILMSSHRQDPLVPLLSTSKIPAVLDGPAISRAPRSRTSTPTTETARPKRSRTLSPAAAATSPRSPGPLTCPSASTASTDSATRYRRRRNARGDAWSRTATSAKRAASGRCTSCSRECPRSTRYLRLATSWPWVPCACCGRPENGCRVTSRSSDSTTLPTRASPTRS